MIQRASSLKSWLACEQIGFSFPRVFPSLTSKTEEPQAYRLWVESGH